ncbi:MAG TPA: FAD-dependent monooxygenase [Pyrinomonadaceae bacterium]|nr:FAD-dependent monooxygenase [Pyrinomonadaceae bacterium]
MTRAVYDVLIVGAGPAGSFAAADLARGGARVALFDGRDPQNAKACGGGVTSKALKAWPFLLEAAGRVVDEVEMYSPAGRGVRLKLRQPFAVYSRRAFDSYLCERARKSGAQVFNARVSAAPLEREGGVWTVRAKGGGEWRGRVLVAADGANSPIARKLAGPLPNAEMEVAFGYRAPLPESDERAATVIAFLPGWAGYAWAFPRLDHVSFGIATTQDAFEHRALDQMLWDFMSGYYRERVGETTSVWSKPGARRDEGEFDESSGEVERKLRACVERYAARIPGLLPETFRTRRAAGEGWALLGDAAGFADPVTGEGIYYALRSGELFAESFLGGKVEAYERRWREDFGRELCRASEMRRRFYGSFLGAPFTERMIDFARLHGGVRRTLRELVAGEQGYLGLKRTLARRAVWPV